MNAVQALICGRPQLYVFTINDSCRGILVNNKRSNFILYESPFIADQVVRKNNVSDGSCFASYCCDPGRTIIDSALETTID